VPRGARRLNNHLLNGFTVCLLTNQSSVYIYTYPKVRH